MLDDIDYSDLTPAQPKAAPTSEPKKKSTIAERSVVKPSEKSGRKQVDVEGLTEKAAQIQADVGAPEIPDPLAQYGLPALGALGALGTAYGVYKSLQNKNPPPPPPPPPPSGPNYSAYDSPAYLRNAFVPPTAPVVAAPTVAPVAPSLPQQTNLTPQDLEARAAQTRAAIAPVAPEMPVSTPITAAPIDAPAPTPTSGPGSPVTTIVNDTVKDMMQQEPSKGMYRDASGKMVYPPEMSPAARAGAEAFAQQYPQHAAALEAEKRFGILGAGSADNNLFNAYGPELRKEILKEVNQGQLAGVYENYPERINPAIKALPPESPIAKQLEALRANDPKGANRGPLGTSAVVTPDVVTPRSKASTALKTAGRAALLVAMADAANAANKGDYVGAAKIAGPALDPTGMLEAAINPQNTARNLTSVSPTFGFLSQLIATRADERAKKAYAEKVGAGRGIAPPSAYQR